MLKFGPPSSAHVRVNPFLAASVDVVDLADAPIRPAWVIAGEPRARAAALSATPGDGMWVNVWECTAGSFRWEYQQDEVIQILAGRARVTRPDGRHVDLGPGDTANFVAGDLAYWNVPDYVRKVAVGVRFASLPARLSCRLRRRATHRRLAAARELGQPQLVPMAPAASAYAVPAAR